MWISKYFVYFTIYSFMGWIYESIFCTIKNGKWQNRGFLYGPVCPIYGVGAASMTYIMEWVSTQGISELPWWKIFLIAFFGSIVLEYVTSYLLEKFFHAYWWDYSDVPLNIHGRVCFPASLGFGIAGLLVVYGVAPVTVLMTSWITPVWLELLSLLFMAVIAADTTLTVSALTNFERSVIAMENALNQHMDQFVNSIQEKTQAASAMLLEERTRFSRENLERSIQNMDWEHRLVLKRVQGFRSSEKEKEKRVYSREMVLESVKKYISAGKRS
jgi:uncharacterized membrane protein